MQLQDFIDAYWIRRSLGMTLVNSYSPLASYRCGSLDGTSMIRFTALSMEGYGAIPQGKTHKVHF
jgi:hypothetical protein